ncbi:hypothetical protein ACFO25_12740 [Paenactinomyces guangxiensis]|uniref:Uncharacterized protein n=1 Tax=Paenactinomyces guangxiensis TaxID=1490290 RepID=A0A7W2A8G0_9BACL|nr:hypothetical protein [Paenactinomyces guangxiensis]MBA4494600.1 hypothetical protein [Paenactinomyces guangxiensis]MBH8591637.1 hypothetical protein [Paenactinomyces guangxiensis]
MNYIFRHGFKLTLANLLGGFIATTVSMLGFAFFYLIIMILILGAAGVSAIGGGSLEDPFAALENAGTGTEIGLAIGLVIFYLISIIFSYLPYSMMFGGTYTSSIEAVYENRSSVGTYLNGAFRYLWKLTGLQLAYLLVSIPLLVVLVITAEFSEQGGFEQSPVSGILLTLIFLLFTFIYVMMFLYSPIFIIKERTGIWKSISLSFSLIFKAFGHVILSGFLFIGIGILFCGIFGVFSFIVLALFGGIDVFTSNSEPGIVFILFAFLLGAIFFLFVLPFTWSASFLVFINYYKRKLRHRLFPPTDSPGHPFPNGHSFQPAFTYNARGNQAETNHRPPDFNV